MPAAKPPATSITREKVSIGLDFRPLPLDIGDGIDWLFNTQASLDDWNALNHGLIAFGSIPQDLEVEEGQEPTPEQIAAVVAANEQMVQLADNLTAALVTLLVDAKQKKAFAERRYNLEALTAFASTYIQQTSGFPTK